MALGSSAGADRPRSPASTSRKGKQIYVEGRLQTRNPGKTSRRGEKRYKTEIVCDNFQMLGRRGEAAESADYGGGAPATSRQ